MGEKPSAWAWVGMLVAVVGVTLASGPELTGDVSARPVVLASSRRSASASTLFCLDRGARTSTLLTLWGMRLTSVAILLVLALALRTAGGVTVRETPALLAIGCGDLAANGLFAYASARGQVSVTSVLGSLYPVVTAIWARFLLDERLRRDPAGRGRPRRGRCRGHRALDPRRHGARRRGRSGARWEDVAS